MSHLPRRAVEHARQLYVGGRRACRTAVPSGGCHATNESKCAEPLPVWGGAAWQQTLGRFSARLQGDPRRLPDRARGGAWEPSSWLTRMRASPGFVLVDRARAAEALAWPARGGGVEFVWTGVSGSPWSESRCPVAEVVPFGGNVSALVRMAQPCFRCFQHKCLVQKKKGKVPPPTTIENVGPSYLRPGQFWLDTASSLIYYRPLPHQQRPSTRAVLPLLEELIRGRGAGAGVGAPIAGLRFEGLSFRHATWFEPSSSKGYVEDQSGVGVACVRSAKDVSESMALCSNACRRALRVRLHRPLFSSLRGSAPRA